MIAKISALLVCMMLLTGLFVAAAPAPSKAPEGVATSVTVPPPRPDSKGATSPNIFVTLLNQDHPGNKIGYRAFEYEPIARGEVPAKGQMADETAKAEKLEAQYAARKGAFKLTIDTHNRANWAPMVWNFYFVPTPEGYDALWVVSTEDQGLNEYYVAQQCLRFSGVNNSTWRRSIAETPAFSEYDLWKKQEEIKQPRASLSFVRRGGRWESFMPSDICVVCATPLGAKMEAAFPGGEAGTTATIRSAFSRQGQPSNFAAAVDSGLAVRTDADRQWLFAMAWDRTTHVSNHHPADCLHSYVNIGPVPPRGKRAIEGKLYWLKTSKDDLYARWRENAR